VPPVDPAAERRRLGLAPDRPTGLVMFGGHGSRAMPAIVSRLGRAAGDLQLIAICGYNGRLADQLKRLRSRLPMRVEGFTNDIPYYMRISDFLIGKPGPASVSEAVHMRLPVIVERNTRTLPQERYNTDWIRERGLGVVVRTFRRVDRAVQSFLRPERLQAYKLNTAAIQNRAVFEMPTLLQTILHAGP
jgi:1,2-diacylglycerol 3-beta-galactosyltransferase